MLVLVYIMCANIKKKYRGWNGIHVSVASVAMCLPAQYPRDTAPLYLPGRVTPVQWSLRSHNGYGHRHWRLRSAWSIVTDMEELQYCTLIVDPCNIAPAILHLLICRLHIISVILHGSRVQYCRCKSIPRVGGILQVQYWRIHPLEMAWNQHMDESANSNYLFLSRKLPAFRKKTKVAKTPHVSILT